MTDSRKKVAKALASVEARLGIEAEARSLAEKQQALSRAHEVVFSEISRWTGIQVAVNDRIPIVREEREVGEMPEKRFYGDPAWQVVQASLIEHKPELEKKISALQAVIKSSEALMTALEGVSYADRASLDGLRFRENALAGSLPLEVRLIKEIGLVNSAAIAAKALSTEAETQSGKLREKLEKRELKPGRPRNEAAHAVARELASLYAKITGKRPTYSEGADGLSGDYTPALRNVFDALGWGKTNLKGPAQAAIKAVSEADLRYEEIEPFGLLSTEWPE